MEIDVQTIDSGREGKTVVFFAAIHGNERCGPQAINRVLHELHGSSLIAGKAVFVPVCNPRAYAQNVRLTDENLNRIFRKSDTPRSYEAHLANELAPLIDVSDALLDIHSITSPGKPFFYFDVPTDDNRAFGEILGTSMAISGWPQLYERLGLAEEAYDTVSYATKQGKPALLIECGQHEDPSSVKVAYTAIIRTLQYFGLLEGTPVRQHVSEIRVEQVYFRKHEQDRFVEAWEHLMPIKEGDALIEEADGTLIRAPFDGFIVMPNDKDPDWLYLGKKVA